MPALRRRPGPITQFLAVIVAVLLIDVSAVAYSAVRENTDGPIAPGARSAIPGPLQQGVDAYASAPDALGITTTPGRPSVIDDGHVRTLVGGRKVLDPDISLRYALASLVTYKDTGDEVWLTRATTSVRDVRRTLTATGLVPHSRPRSDGAGKDLPKGWVSAETQGLMLSAASRLATITKERSWRTTATAVFDGLLRLRGGMDDEYRLNDPWLTFVDNNELLWFEDLPQGPEPTETMTSHLTALIGIYDFMPVADEDRRDTAKTTFLNGATTAMQFSPRLWYPNFAAWTSPLQVTNSWPRHHAVVAQLDVMTSITRRPEFTQVADTLRGDAFMPEFATTDTTPTGDVDAYSRPGALPLTGPAESSDPAAPERSEGGATESPDGRLAAAISALSRNADGEDPAALQEAVGLVNGVLDTSTRGLVPHTATVRAFGQPLATPWYSAQTQGLLLSALVRLEAATGDETWADEAGAVFATMRLHRAYPPTSPREAPDTWTSFIGDQKDTDTLWFEKYAPQKKVDNTDLPTFVVDTQGTALIGLYDYWRMTKSPEAARLFDAGVSTLRKRLPDLRRPGSISDAAWEAGIYRLDHHRVVTRQLAVLGQMTDDPRLRRAAQQFAQDAS